MKFEEEEALLAWLMNWFSENFPTQAIIKGGMGLRLLSSSRDTNDLDFVFVPFLSRKDVDPLVREKLDAVAGLKYSQRLDSRSLRYVIHYGGQKAQVEISVHNKCPSNPMSSSALSEPHGLQGGLVRVMEPGVALSHKIAAWNERGLMRDLYDILFLYRIQKVEPDMDVLFHRLKHVRRMRRKEFSMELGQLCSSLGKSADQLKQQELVEELAGSIPEVELPGLCERISVALRLLVVYLERV